MSPEMHLGLVQYTKQVDPWFDYRGSPTYNFATAAQILNWLKVGTRVTFIHKYSQSPDLARLLKEQYLKCYRKVCADAQTNPDPMTMDRWDPYEAGLRTACAASNLSTTFDKKHIRALKVIDQPSDLDQVLASNLKNIEMGKLLESHTMLHLAAVPRGRDRGRGA